MGLISIKYLKRTVLFCAIVLLAMTTMTSTHTALAESHGDLSINPKPQEMKRTDENISLPSKVGLVVGEGTDEQAINQVIEALEQAGVDEIVRDTTSEKLNTEVKIWVGGPAENAESAEVLAQMGVEGPETLDDEGYVLAANQEQQKIVLAGKDETGTFYAAQTVKQILQDTKDTQSFPQVEIRDWPDMQIRGSIEGFYGPPWTHEDRLNQLDFYGDNKLNTYIYAPKDDPYHREDWRVPYPEDELDQIKELIDRAHDNHVKFTFSISPGQSICYSSDEDYAYLEEKMEAIWDLGVRSYAIFLDDIDKTFHCAEDRDMFQNDEDPIAAAHAYLLNRFNEQFIETHDGAGRLITVPTDYSGGGTTTYRNRFADLLNDDTVVMWTGQKVVSESITAEDVADIYDVFKHDIVLWDNYPVNDFDRNSLFIGPLVNRDANLTEHGVHGLTANPMNEAEASKIPLYTVADYTWNPYDYDPEASWERSVQSFGGDAADVLRKFAENTYSSPLNDTESLTLAPLIESFWEAYVNQENLEQAANQLKEEFQTLQQLPSELRNQMNNEKFLQEIAPYLEKLKIYGETGEVAVDYVVAKQKGNDEEADNYQEKFVRLFNSSEAIPQKMGQGVIKSFLIESALTMAPLEHTLEPTIEEFNEAIGEDHFEQAAEKLMEEFESLQEIAAETRENFDDERFVETIEPYLQNLTTYGDAGEVAVKYVMAKESNQSDEARDYKNQLKALLIQAYKVPQKVGGKVIKPFLIDVMWDDLNVVEYYELDGVNTSRGGGELIQYTPDHGDSTRTNNWGYEVTIENGIVVKRGGNDSKIPENGYVLSIHGSDWLRDYAELGMEVQIEDGIVLIIDPTTEVSTVSDMIELVDQYEADDAISDSKVARALKIHLMAVKRYADTGQAAKVVKHMKGFETLLDYHHNNDALSDKAYTTLKDGTEAIVDKWK